MHWCMVGAQETCSQPFLETSSKGDRAPLEFPQGTIFKPAWYEHLLIH